MSAPTRAEIQAWLVDEVARRREMAPAMIDVTAPFADYQLDSIVAVGLAGDLETWLGVQLDATLIWDYPTIDKLAEHLGNLVRERER